MAGDSPPEARTGRETANPIGVYRFGAFELRTSQRQLLKDGRPVVLGQRAFDVLLALVERGGQLVTKNELLDRVWPGLVVEENNLQVQISTLRKVLGTSAIATIASRGYRFTLDGATPGGAADAAEAVRASDAIAVLPLHNLSGQPAEEYFADGMTEALITDLTKIAGLRVISRGSVMGFKGTRQPLSEIGRALGVTALVEGSVLRAGDRVRISIRLVDVRTDEYVWAERYDRELADVLALQDELARAIARAIDQALHPRPRETPRRVDPEVYLLDLRGRHLLHQRTEAGFRAALRMFEDAVAQDPTYAPAYVGMAESLNMLANYGLVPPQQIRPRSLAAVRRALELDEGSADAHRVLAFVHWQFAFEWEKAIAEYERALEIAPNSSSATYWFGTCLAVIGHFDRAHQLLGRAQEMDPLSLLVPSVRGWARIFARQFEAALPILEEVLRIDPGYHVALWFKGEALVELQRHEEGVASLDRAYQLGGRTSRLLGYLGYAYGRAGQAERARECLAELESRERRQEYVAPYFPALVLSGLEDHAGALERLERAYAGGDTMLRDLKADPQWDRMRSMPRFEALMRKMAYPAPTPTAGGHPASRS
jgi:TolB-like protein/Flp pilus assembly protein TadD